MSNGRYESNRERAIDSMARVLYADTLMAEDYDDLSSGEKEHYRSLATSCFSKVEDIFPMMRDVDSAGDQTVTTGRRVEQ